MNRFFKVMVVLMLAAGGALFAAEGDAYVDADGVSHTELAVPAGVLSVLADYGFDTGLITGGIDLTAAQNRELARIDYLSGEGISSAMESALYDYVVFKAKGPACLRIGNMFHTLKLN